MTTLLSKDHRILEKGTMEFRPFGVDSRGNSIRDASGVLVRANVDYLEEFVSSRQGTEAGQKAVEELCCLLNERIADPSYHVNPENLKNYWNSYSYEFVIFLAEFCGIISGDPNFQSNMGEQKLLLPALDIHVAVILPVFGIRGHVKTTLDRSAYIAYSARERGHRRR